VRSAAIAFPNMAMPTNVTASSPTVDLMMPDPALLDMVEYLLICVVVK
jgi:hypothetical protein